MSSTFKAIKLSAVLLAGSSLFAMQPAMAQSCTTDAWDSATNATAGSPADTTPVKRYSGACGLAPTMTGGYVVESTNHAAEGGATPFTARFYVFTGVTAGTPVVFRALDADSSGNSVIDVTYDSVDQNFDFAVNGSNVGSTTAGSAPRNRWIGVKLTYQASTAFSASTRAAGDVTALSVGGFTPGAATIEAVQLGVIAANGASGNLYFDEYEASRAADTGAAVPPICRGDANNDGNINVFDTIQVINERLNGTLVAGQSDCNEDGSVNVFDTICVVGLRLASTSCN